MKRPLIALAIAAIAAIALTGCFTDGQVEACKKAHPIYTKYLGKGEHTSRKVDMPYLANVKLVVIDVTLGDRTKHTFACTVASDGTVIDTAHLYEEVLVRGTGILELILEY